MLIAFDSLHNTESMGTSQFSREQRYNEIRFKFCKFAGGKRKFAGDQQEKTHGREKQRHHLESAPPSPFLFIPAPPLELSLSWPFSGPGSCHISLMPWGSWVHRAESHVTSGRASMSLEMQLATQFL